MNIQGRRWRSVYLWLVSFSYKCSCISNLISMSYIMVPSWAVYRLWYLAGSCPRRSWPMMPRIYWRQFVAACHRVMEFVLAEWSCSIGRSRKRPPRMHHAISLWITTTTIMIITMITTTMITRPSSTSPTQRKTCAARTSALGSTITISRVTLGNPMKSKSFSRSIMPCIIRTKSRAWTVLVQPQSSMWTPFLRRPTWSMGYVFYSI